MGKKIIVPYLDVIMIAFFWFSIRNMVFHCIFLGKKGTSWRVLQTKAEDHYYMPVLSSRVRLRGR